MGKRIIVQARGKGSSTYRVKKKAFRYQIKIPSNAAGEGTVIKLLNSPAHSAPLAKIEFSEGSFYVPAFKGMYEGQKIVISSSVPTEKEISEGKKEGIREGDILRVSDIPLKTKIYCIESRPGDGGKFIKSAGNFAIINRAVGEDVYVLFPSKKEKKLNKNCRAIIGVVAGAGRLDKPLLKAGKNYHIKKAKSKLWPRTGALKMNAIDHPFGSGRGKNPKSKIAKRNSAPGQKVGLLRPKRTGKRK